ncbi:hypothetical protein BDC45DRAFT_45936 [Circinella umbellata]|nr:hypothetical protein BDC45DRAFT_45936 [Circinella umbellata]
MQQKQHNNNTAFNFLLFLLFILHQFYKHIIFITVTITTLFFPLLLSLFISDQISQFAYIFHNNITYTYL